MLTKSDLKQIQNLLNRALKGFATKDDLQGLKKELKNDIVQFKDDILHEIIELREANTITTGYRDLIEDHNERIEKLEGKVFAD